jgi:hypothetical protein
MENPKTSTYLPFIDIFTYLASGFQTDTSKLARSASVGFSLLPVSLIVTDFSGKKGSKDIKQFFVWLALTH